MDKKNENGRHDGLVLDPRFSDDENLRPIEERNAPNGSRNPKYHEKRKLESELPYL